MLDLNNGKGEYKSTRGVLPTTNDDAVFVENVMKP